MEQKGFKAGFVSIVGRPNVGKSTLMNRLVGENLSIVSPKEQTTRHRIMGIINGEGYQIVYSDTPGILEPKYALHEAMMNFVKVSLEDADLILLLVDVKETYDALLFDRLKKAGTPIILVLNKTDRAKAPEVAERTAYWQARMDGLLAEVVPVSALKGQNVPELLNILVQRLPEHPAYFPQDELTNRSERFFAAEIVREKIFFNYEQEVPYSSEVVITAFKEEPDIIRIQAEIYVERTTQRAILIGKGGSMLKKVGTEARQAMEAFFQKKVFLETYVKVAKDWRKEKNRLRQFGYLE